MRMHEFQNRLDELGKRNPDTVEASTRQLEAQQAIEDILIKYREAQQAK